jgi:outer membrane protein assembly factor BamB
MKAFKFMVIFIIFTTSCCKDDDIKTKTDSDGVIVSLPYIWKTSLHQNGAVSNSNFDVPIIYNNNILIPTTNGGNNRLMSLINSKTGEYVWSWDDRYQPETERISITYKHQKDNLLTYQNGRRNYCINLDSGTTHWKIMRDYSFSVKMSGLDSTYFVFGPSTSNYQEYQENVGFKGDIQTGEIEEFLVPNFTLEHILGNRIGDVTRMEPYMYNGVQHLVVTWQEITSDHSWLFQTYLGLYNYETNQWVYEKRIINEPNVNGTVKTKPVIYNDKFYVNVGHQLFCHDIATGDQIWFKTFPQDFMFSGFIIEEDKIIANNEDTFTYGINPENGNILWKTETSGTSSRISYLNGIAYFVGGSSDRLHGIDVNTGEHVWKIKVSNLGEPADNGFKPNAVYVFPAQDDEPAKVIALSHKNAYCFEAYQ